MSAEMKHNYQVVLDTETSYSYLIEDANTPEEAEESARALFEDGEMGEVVEQEIYDTDVFPAGDSE